MKKNVLNALKRIINLLDSRKEIDYLPEKEWHKYYIYSKSIKNLYSNEGLDNSPDVVREYFEKCAKNWTFDKFYFFYDNICTIEPIYGWAINEKMQFIPHSIWNNYLNNIKPSYYRFKLVKRKKIYLESAIVLSYAWNNYWHFYNDIMGQLKIADDFGLSLDIPIVVNCGLKNMNYFKQIVERSERLNNREWIFQDKDTEVVCEKAHFFNTYWASIDNFNYVVDLVDFNNNNYDLDRRIFISRKSVRGRNIININEVKKVLDKYKFEIIECDDMTVKQQAELFSSSSYVIGIHGAGLTNIVYRRGHRMSLLEIFSKDFFNPPYFWMCQQYGYAYYSMVAGGSDTPDDPNGNFLIDTNELERKIADMVQ